MRKITFYLETWFNQGSISATRKYDDNASDEEIEEDLKEWVENEVSYGWQESE